MSYKDHTPCKVTQHAAATVAQDDHFTVKTRYVCMIQSNLEVLNTDISMYPLISKNTV